MTGKQFNETPTVKELIVELSKFNPEAKVYVYDHEYADSTDIESIFEEEGVGVVIK